MQPLLALIGLPGGRKVSIGQQVAAHLNTEYWHCAEIIENLTGRSLPDWIVNSSPAEAGEIHLKSIEWAAHQAGVLVIPSGTLNAPGVENTVRQLQAQGTAVAHLVVDIGASLQAAGLHSPRPTGLGNINNQYRTFATTSQKLYNSLADFNVDIARHTVESAAEEILVGYARHLLREPKNLERQ